LPDTAQVASAAVEKPAKSATAVAAAKPVPLPENSPFALASAEPQMDQGFDAAAPRPVQKQTAQKKRERVAAPAADVEVASADQPAKPSKKRIIDPDLAPLPTARASMLVLPGSKPAKAAKAPAVQVAAEQPLAARFGRSDDEPAVSLGFAQ
jgi:hypothetical protein